MTALRRARTAGCGPLPAGRPRTPSIPYTHCRPGGYTRPSHPGGGAGGLAGTVDPGAPVPSAGRFRRSVVPAASVHDARCAAARSRTQPVCLSRAPPRHSHPRARLVGPMPAASAAVNRRPALWAGFVLAQEASRVPCSPRRPAPSARATAWLDDGVARVRWRPSSKSATASGVAHGSTIWKLYGFGWRGCGQRDVVPHLRGSNDVARAQHGIASVPQASPEVPLPLE